MTFGVMKGGLHDGAWATRAAFGEHFHRFVYKNGQWIMHEKCNCETTDKEE